MPKGGKRPGAGRPLGSGKYGESTVAIRMPASLEERLDEWIANPTCGLPYYRSGVFAGIPAERPADSASRITLKDLLNVRNDASYIVTVIGDSMENAGICEDDHLIVDPKAEPRPGDIVIAVIDGETTVKRLMKDGKGYALHPENPKYSPIRLEPEMDVRIQGVVRASVRTL